MEFLTIVIKSLIILAMVLLMAVPFALEFFTFSRDKANKISYKRFRIVVYTGIYVVLITVAMMLLHELFAWLEALSVVQWVVEKLAVSHQITYFTKVPLYFGSKFYQICFKLAVHAFFIHFHGFR